jgi:2-polyprenyl-3-methyl-5-hydroxy-6-metoxy-1,4-benzoquinol methylase
VDSVPNTDDAWKRFGQDDPYYAVLTKDGFQKAHFDQAAREAFFRSGRDYVGMVLDLARCHLEADTHFHRILDFGCGVGRLALAFASHCDEVVGVDVSTGMLAEANSNAEAFDVHNAHWAVSDDNLTQVAGEFDLVHTFITLQHIAPRRGYRIISNVISRLRQHGIGIVHLTYAHASRTPHARRLLTSLYEQLPYAFAARNLLKFSAFNSPQMLMSRYNMSKVMRILQEGSCHKLHVRFTEASHYRYPIYGAILLFRKERLDVATHS